MTTTTDVVRTTRNNLLVETVVNTLPSKGSHPAYRVALNSFLRWVGDRQIGRETVLGYLSEMEEAGKRPATMNVHLSAIKKLCHEAMERGWMDGTEAARVDRIPGRRKLGTHIGNWLSPEQIQNVLASQKMDTLIGRRNATILHLLYGCALRRSEVVNLKVGQIQQRDGRWMLVDMEGKGRRIRTVVIPTPSVPVIVAWADLRKRVDKADDDDPLIVTAYGRKAADALVFKVVQRVVGPLGIEASPHDFRRSFAKHALDGGASLRKIQTSLGHSSQAVTERYLGVDQELEDPAADYLPYVTGKNGKKAKE